MEEFPRASLSELSITDTWLMIYNTYLYAEKFAYKGKRRDRIIWIGIIEGDRPSPEYTDKAWYYCRRLITIAGYRTGDILKNLLSKISL